MNLGQKIVKHAKPGSPSLDLHGRSETGRRKRFAATASIVFAAAVPLSVRGSTLYFDPTGGATLGGSGTFTSQSTALYSSTAAGGGPLVQLGTTDTGVFAGTAGTVTVATATYTGGAFVFNTTGYTLATANATRVLAGPITLANNVGLTLAPIPSAPLTVSSITGGTNTSLTLAGTTAAAGDAVRINVTAGATIDASTPITVTTAGTLGLTGFVSSVGTGVINASIVNNSNVTLMLGATSSFILNVNGVVSSGSTSTSPGVEFTAGTSGGAGFIDLNAANTYTGVSEFNGTAPGAVKLGILNAIPTTSAVIMGFSSGKGQNLDLNGFSQTVASLASNAGGTGSIVDTATGNATDTLTINGSASTSFALPITAGATRAVALAQSGTGVLTLSATSTYNGGTTINSGVIQAGVAGALPKVGLVTLGNTAGALLDLNTFNQTIGNLSGGGTTGGNVALGGAALTVGDATNQTFAGNIADSGGASTVTGGSLTKVGSGALTFSGSISYSGSTSVSAGTLNYTGNGSSSGDGAATIGSATTNGVLNINAPGGTVSYSSTVGGAASTAAGAVNLSAGTFNSDLGSVTTGGYLNLSSKGYGSVNVSGGTLSTLGLPSGGTPASYGINVADSGGTGVLTQTGGNIIINRAILIANQGGTGVATFVGGTVTSTGSSVGGINVTYNDTNGTSNYGVFNLGTLNGGTALFATNGGLNFSAGSGTINENGTANLNAGTLKLIAGSINLKNASTGSNVLNLDGGTIQAGAGSLTLISNTNGLTGTVYNGNASFDTQAFTSTVSANLVPATGNGFYPTVSGTNLAVTSGGSGYIGAPLVTVTDTTNGTATGATAIATVANGSVSGVTITNPGQGYNAGDSLSFAFAGGGTSTGASTFTTTIANSDSILNNGGLTKIGSGTLILTGANSYTGTTNVNAGMLVLNGTHTGGAQYNIGNGTAAASFGGTGSTASVVSVNTNATIEPGSGKGTGALTVSGVSGTGTYQADISSLNGSSDTASSLVVPSAASSSAVNLSGMTLNLNLISVTGLAQAGTIETFTIIDNQTSQTAATEGQFANVTSSSPGFTYTVNYGQNVEADGANNDVTLTITSVPEPGSVCLFAAAGLGLLSRRRRASARPSINA